MNTTRLIEIAKQLTKDYTDRMSANLRLWQWEKDLEARQTAMIQPEGWPGSNKEAREDARTKAYQADETCQKIEVQIVTLRRLIAATDAEIAGLEAERRALEWEIRGELVKALQLNHLEYSGAVEETAFDEAAQAELDNPGAYAYASSVDGVPF